VRKDTAMRINIALLLMVLVFTGCGYNPMSPRNYTSFYGLLNDMESVENLGWWLTKHVEYDSKHTRGKQGDGDIVRRMALYMFANRKGGCLQYSAMFAYAARWHNKRSGVFGFFGGEAGEIYSGHAFAWIEERDGAITTTNNNHVSRRSYSSYEAMVKYFETELSAGSHYVIWDSKMEEVLATDLENTIIELVRE
jgi:hypothetical protein